MNRPSVCRGFIDKNIMETLDKMRLRASIYLADELDLLLRLERTKHAELSVHITKLVYELLGGEVSEPKDPRFDKTRRQLAKRRGRPPRGMSKAETRAQRVKENGPSRPGKGIGRAIVTADLMDKQFDAEEQFSAT